MFTNLAATTEGTKSFVTRKNLATQDMLTLTVSYPFQYKSFSSFINISSNYSHYKADFGGGSRIVNLDVTSFNFFMQNSLKFGCKKLWTAELSGRFNSLSIAGNLPVKSMGADDAGLLKLIFKGKGNFKIALTDIFFTQLLSAESNFAGQKIKVTNISESRQIRYSLTWRFGNSKVKAARQRNDASYEEKKRVQ